MAYVNVRVDAEIDTNDLITELSTSEKQELFDELAEVLGYTEYIPNIVDRIHKSGSHPAEECYREALRKLQGSYSRLPAKAIESIEELADRYGEY